MVMIYISLALTGWVWPHAPDPPNYGLPHPQSQLSLKIATRNDSDLGLKD